MSKENTEALSNDRTLRVPIDGGMADPTLRIPGEVAADPSDSTSGQEGVGGSSTSDSTLLVGRDSVSVVLPEKPLESRRVLPLGVLHPGEVICGNCRVRETVRPHETTRPGLYDCDAPEGRVMVKILAAEFPPRQDLWMKLPELNHPALLRTYRVEMEQGFHAEVQEFCEGGTLDDCVPRAGRPPLPWDTIERGIVASFVAGAAHLHFNGIVHRDIKPKNLYLRKNGERVSLVIADFDISSVIETDNTSRDTPRGAGTHYYMAPEAFPRFVDPAAGRAAAIVSPASDFYSFGAVLIELLVGTTVLHSGRWSDVYDFYMAGGRLEIPDGLPVRARELIQGLLIRNRRTRWGIDEVSRWLRHETTELDRQKIREDAGYEMVRRAVRAYNVFPSSPTDVHGLARAMSENPSLAEEELLSGDVLVNWLGELDTKLAREVRRDRETYRHSPRLAVMAAIMRLDPTLPLMVHDSLSVTSLAELIQKSEVWLREGRIDLSDLVNRGALLRLEAWLRLKSDPELYQAHGVSIMYEAWWGSTAGNTMTPINQRIAFEELKWLADPMRPFYITKEVSAKTPTELARICYGTNADWKNGVPSLYRAAMDRWKDGLLGAWLRQRARDENGVVSPVVYQLENLRQKETRGKEPMWEVVLRMLDPGLPRVRLRISTPAETVHLATEWGGVATGQLQYEAVGPGLPFGVWKLADAPPGLTVEPLEISLRQGAVSFRLKTLHNLEPGSAGTVHFSLQPGGNCVLEENGNVVYRVRPAAKQHRTYMWNGALMGAGILGGARLVAFAWTGPEWSPAAPGNTAPVTGTLAGAEAAAMAEAANVAEMPEPPQSYIFAALTMIVGGVAVFYCWLNCFRRFANH